MQPITNPFRWPIRPILYGMNNFSLQVNKYVAMRCRNSYNAPVCGSYSTAALHCSRSGVQSADARRSSSTANLPVVVGQQSLLKLLRLNGCLRLVSGGGISQNGSAKGLLMSKIRYVLTAVSLSILHCIGTTGKSRKRFTLIIANRSPIQPTTTCLISSPLVQSAMVSNRV